MAVRLPEEHHQALTRIAAARDISVSELVRQAVAIVCEIEPDDRPTLDLDAAVSQNIFIRAARRS
jgi:predicted transcriptional regulator